MINKKEFKDYIKKKDKIDIDFLDKKITHEEFKKRRRELLNKLLKK